MGVQDRAGGLQAQGGPMAAHSQHQTSNPLDRYPCSICTVPYWQDAGPSLELASVAEQGPGPGADTLRRRPRKSCRAGPCCRQSGAGRAPEMMASGRLHAVHGAVDTATNGTPLVRAGTPRSKGSARQPGPMAVAETKWLATMSAMRWACLAKSRVVSLQQVPQGCCALFHWSPISKPPAVCQRSYTQSRAPTQAP